MLGISTSLVKGGMTGRQYVKDGLKLYMPYRGSDLTKGTQFVGTGSTSFDGSNDYVSVADDSTLDFGTGDFTVGFWYKSDANYAVDETIISKKTGFAGTVAGWVIYPESNHSARFRVANGSAALAISHDTTALNDKVWHYVTGIKSGDDLLIYTDGILGTDTAVTGVNAYNTDNALALYLGRVDTTYQSGNIKNVAIWSRALTATEVQNVMYKSYAEVSGRLASGLVSWWALDVDYTDSKGSNNGTNNGSTLNADLYGGDTPVIPRAIDNAPTVQADAIGVGSASFDGTDDYIITGSNVSISGATARTVTAWVNFGDVTGNQWIFGWGAGSTRNAFGVFSSGADLLFMVYGDDDTVSSALSAGVWYHIAYTYDGSTTTKCYVDGILKATGSLGGALDTTAGKLVIGGQPYGTVGTTDEINGNICQVGVWSRALDQATIQSVMEKTFEELTASEKTNLVSYWALDEANGLIVSDKIDDTSLGSELVSNGDFSTDSTGWYDDNNATFEVTGGELHAITSGTAFDGVRFQLPAVVSGKIYKIQFDYRVVGSSMTFYIFNNDTGTSSASDTNGTASTAISATSTTTQTIYWQCTASNSSARLSFVNGGSASREIYIDNVSCKLFGTDGNHGVLI